MKALLEFSKIVDFVNERFGRVADYLVLAACLVSAGNAAVRYVFNYSTNGLLEIQWYMFGAIVLLGASYTLKMNEHVRVDIIYSIISDRARLWVDTVGFVVFMIPVLVFLTYTSWFFFITSFRLQEYSTNAGGLILWPVKMMLPLGFGLLLLQTLSELIKRIAALRGEFALETKYEKPLQ